MTDFRYKTRFYYPDCAVTSGPHTPLCTNKGAYLPAITAAYIDNQPSIQSQYQFTDGETSQTLSFWTNNSIGTKFGHITWGMNGRWLTINWGDHTDVCLVEPDGSSFRGRDNPDIYGVLIDYPI